VAATDDVDDWHVFNGVIHERTYQGNKYIKPSMTLFKDFKLLTAVIVM